MINNASRKANAEDKRWLMFPCRKVAHSVAEAAKNCARDAVSSDANGGAR
jgi:hypothetical protein